MKSGDKDKKGNKDNVNSPVRTNVSRGSHVVTRGAISIGADGTKKLDIRQVLKTIEGKRKLAELTSEIPSPNKP